MISCGNHVSMLDGHFFIHKFARDVYSTPNNTPWTPTAHRFFTMPVVQSLLSCAQAFPAFSHVVNDGPLDVEQQTVRTCVDLMRHNQWLNIFPEGGIYGPHFPRDEGRLQTKGGRKSDVDDIIAPCCW